MSLHALMPPCIHGNDRIICHRQLYNFEPTSHWINCSETHKVNYFTVLLVMFVPLVYLAFLTVFDTCLDGTMHTFPIHSNAKSFFEMCRPRMLQIVVIPAKHPGVKGHRNN